MSRSRLFEHAQETIRLLAMQARDGHAEGVRKYTKRDDQMVVKTMYQAALQLLPEVEETGHAFTLVKKSLTQKQYKLLADLVRPAGWHISRYHEVAGFSRKDRPAVLHYMHTGSVPELERGLRQLMVKGTVVFDDTL